MAIKTEEEQKAFEKECDHIGYHNPVSVSAVPVGEALLLALCHNCSNCGRNFILLNPLTSKSPTEEKSKIVS